MSVDELIRQHRTAEATVTVITGAEPLANAEVTVAQTRHKFLFGSTGFEFIPLANDEIDGEERTQMEQLAA
jgi:endo-1,4-beta-xylanase